MPHPLHREDDVSIAYTSREVLRDVAGLVAPYKWRFLGASVLRLIGDIAWLYPAIALSTIITFFTTYEPGQSLSSVWTALGLWALALMVRSTGQFAAKNEGYKIAERVALDSSLGTLRHLIRLDMRWHERENSGNKLKRIHNAGLALNRLVRMWFDNILEIVVNFVGIAFILSSIDIVILGFLFLFTVTFFGISILLTKRAAAASYLVNAQEEVVQGLQFEAVNNVRTVKVLGIAEPLMKFIGSATEDLNARLRTRIFRFQSRGWFLYLWGYGFNIGILAFIVWGISVGRYEVGLLVLFHSYFGRIWESVSELASFLQDFTTAKYSLARMQDILDEPVGIDDDAGKVPVPDAWSTIVVDAVSFGYGENAVLKDISFTVARGEKVGIVGLSGAGKSTLFKLLLKEREDYEGAIRFDDVPLTHIKRSDYFAHVSAVLQDTEVFNLSLQENIMISRGEVNETALARALEVAHITDFMHKLPQGLATVIGEKGIKLSGGERQRLGIARAVYQEPQVLLLDEATSHLDLESEEKIQDSLHEFFKGVTAIVIAHRLTTIKEMDKIIVLEGGGVVEMGTFDELSQKGGRFKELWDKQKL